MAYIEERKTSSGDVKYRVMVRLQGYPTRSATFKRKTDAKVWAQKTEAFMREGRYFDLAESSKHTMAELIDRYIKTHLHSKKDARNQKRHLLWWKHKLGKYALSKVTPPLIIECRQKLIEGGRTNSTANRYVCSLSHPLTIARKEWDWIKENPIHRISKLKEPRGRVRYLDESEMERLLEECRKDRNPALYVAVVLSLSTGARQGEVWGLKWNQVNLEQGSIILHETKNGERRILPLRGHALQLMRDRFHARNLESNLVFHGSRNIFESINLRYPFIEAVRRAQIKDFRWHDLRHTAASYLAMNGASPNTIAEILGHKTLAMVKRYAHLSDTYLASQVESMNEKMFGGES